MNYAEKIQEQQHLLERIKAATELCDAGNGKIPKIAKYAEMHRTTIDRYMQGKQNTQLENIGKIIVGIKRYAQEDCQNSSLAEAISIEAMSSGLSQDEYRKRLRVSGKEMLVKKLSEKITKLSDAGDEHFEHQDYAFDLIRGWEETEVGEKLLKDVYIKMRLKKCDERVDDVLDNWVQQLDLPAFFLLLGDIGAGKTTCLHAFAARQALRHIENPQREPLPFYIDLAKYKLAKNLLTVCKAILFDDFDHKIDSIDQLLRLATRGRIVFVLDGFDEMATNLSEDLLFEHLLQIEKLYHVNGKLLLSSRKQLFSSQEQVLQLLKKTAMGEKIASSSGAPRELDVLNKEDVEGYINRYFDSSNLKALRNLQNLESFQELSSHPMMLDMMVQITPHLKGIKNLTKADIFRMYYDQWYSRKKERRLIESNDLNIFCQKLAGALWKFEKPRISYGRLKDEVRKYFNPEDPKIYENLTMAISNDSFLKRDDQDWSFMHEAFYHFFLATAIGESQGDFKNILQEKDLPENVLEFLVGIDIDTDQLVVTATSIKKKREVDRSYSEKVLLKNINQVLRVKGFGSYFIDLLTPILSQKITEVPGLLAISKETLPQIEPSDSTTILDILDSFVREKTKFAGISGLSETEVDGAFNLLAEFQGSEMPGKNNPPVNLQGYLESVTQRGEVTEVKLLEGFLRDCPPIVKINKSADNVEKISFTDDLGSHYFAAKSLYGNFETRVHKGMGNAPVNGLVLNWFWEIVQTKELGTVDAAETLANTLYTWVQKTRDEAWLRSAGKYAGGICLSILCYVNNNLGALQKSRLSLPSLANGNFFSSYLVDADFEEEDLSGINLSHSYLERCNFKKSTLKEAKLTGVNFNGSSLTKADFTGAELSSARFDAAHIDNVDFTGCNLTEADFSNVESSNNIKTSHAIMTRVKGLN